MRAHYSVRRAIFSCLLCIFVTACSHADPSLPPVIPPGGNGGPPPTSTPGPTPTPVQTATPTPGPSSTPGFNPALVHITEHKVAVTPLYLAAGPDHAAYFGFGANGSGSNLYRYISGSIVETTPANPPSGYAPGGGVYGITVTNSGRVFWLSAYFGPSFSLYVTVECGGSGGKASICQPTVDEPTSMLVDSSGSFWVAGLSFNGGGQIVTSSNASASFARASVMQILNGPGLRVWGALADFSQSPTQYSIAEFVVSGHSIAIQHDYVLPRGDSVASMTLGGDGDLWFTDNQRNAIGRMTASGSLREFPLRSPNALAAPFYGQWQIATSCDGAVWFTEPGPDNVGRMDSSGRLNEFALPTPGALPGPIAAAPSLDRRCGSGELWVGEEHANALAEVHF